MASLISCEIELPSQSTQFGWSGITTSIVLYGAIGFLLLVLFGCIRSNESVFKSRRYVQPLRTPANYSESRSREELLERIGLDGYVLISFIRISGCIVFSYFIGGIILIPIYATAQPNLDSYTLISMGNVPQASNLLWVCCFMHIALMYVTLRFLAGELTRHAQDRLCFLLAGDRDVPRQALFSAQFENLPVKLSQPDSIKAFLERLVGDDIYEARVAERVPPKLRALKSQIDEFSDKIEAANIGLLVSQNEGEPEHTIWCSKSPIDDSGEIDIRSNRCKKTVRTIPFYRRELTSKQGEYNRESTAMVENPSYAHTAFVTFRSQKSVAILTSCNVGNHMNLICTSAPDPRNVLWANICISTGRIDTKVTLTNIVVFAVAIFVFIPLLVFCNIFGNIEELSKVIPGLDTLSPTSFAYTFITTQVPPLLQTIIVSLLPPFFMWLGGSVETRKLKSSVERSVLSRSFAFQIVNIYFTLLGNSLATTVVSIVQNPQVIQTHVPKSRLYLTWS